MLNMRILLTRMKHQRIFSSQFYRFCALKKYTKEHEWVSLENDIVNSTNLR